jgi:hypothetical protein
MNPLFKPEAIILKVLDMIEERVDRNIKQVDADVVLANVVDLTESEAISTKVASILVKMNEAWRRHDDQRYELQNRAQAAETKRDRLAAYVDADDMGGWGPSRSETI